MDAFESSQLNAAKTEVLWSTTRRRLHQLPQSLFLVGTDLVASTAVIRNFGIFIDADVSMRSNVTRTVSSCFAILCQLRCIRRLVPRTVLQSLVSSLVLIRQDYGNATLAGIPGHLVQLQSVINAAARMIFSTSRYDHVTPFLRQLHWLKAQKRIDNKLAVLVYNCQHATGPAYLAYELSHASDFVNRRKLCSASSLNLIVRRTRVSTCSDRAFPVAGPCVWNSLPPHVTSALSVSTLRFRLKTFSSLAPILKLFVSLCVKCLCSACGTLDTIVVHYYYYY